MAKIADIAKDVFIIYHNDLCVIIEFQRVSPGKGSSFVRTKLKSIGSGKVLENNFKDGDDIEVVSVERRNMQYLYGGGDEYTFMDNTTFDQVSVNVNLLDGKERFLKEGIEATIMMYDGRPVGVQLPKKVTLKVVSAPEAVRGDTSGNVQKEAELETGALIRVPLFINSGDTIIINTDTGDYGGRAGE